MPKKSHSITVIQTFPETITTVCPLLGEVGASSCYKICLRSISVFRILTLSLIFQLKQSQSWSAWGCNRGDLLLELLVEKIYSVIVDNNVIFLTQTITKNCLNYSHLLLLSFLAETRSVSCLLTKPNEVLTWAFDISSLCLSVTRVFTDCHDNSESTHLVRTRSDVYGRSYVNSLPF